MPLAESVRRIRDHIKQIGVQYDEEINKQYANIPRLLDRGSFSEIRDLLHGMLWVSLHSENKQISFTNAKQGF